MRPDEEQCSAVPIRAAQNLCIFLASGRTYTFIDVRHVVDNENCLSFSYTAMSDGRDKNAVFYKYCGAIAGVSRY